MLREVHVIVVDYVKMDNFHNGCIQGKYESNYFHHYPTEKDFISVEKELLEKNIAYGSKFRVVKYYL
jgi:hypothetical protein